MKGKDFSIQSENGENVALLVTDSNSSSSDKISSMASVESCTASLKSLTECRTDGGRIDSF